MRVWRQAWQVASRPKSCSVTIVGNGASTELPVTVDSDTRVEIRSAQGSVTLRVCPTVVKPVVRLCARSNGVARIDEGTVKIGAEDGTLEATVPQRVGRAIVSAACDALVDGKFEVGGRASIDAGELVEVSTLRAHQVDLTCDVARASRLLEGEETTVRARRVRVSKLQARRAEIAARDDARVESSYCADLDLTGRDATLHTVHGHARARLDGALSIARLSGSIDASARVVDVRFDSQHARPSRLDAIADLSVLVCADDDVALRLEAPAIDTSRADAKLLVSADGRSAAGNRVLRARLASAATDPTRYKRGAGKIHVAGASTQRWDSAVDSGKPAASTLDATAGGTLTLLEPASWIDTIRARVFSS